MRLIQILLLAAMSTAAAEKVSVTALFDLSKKPDAPEFREALTPTLGTAALKAGTAWIGEGTDFVWALECASAPTLIVDNASRGAMRRIAGTELWYATGRVSPAGKLHWFEYQVDGKQFGGSTQAGQQIRRGWLSFPFTGPIRMLIPVCLRASCPRPSPSPAGFTKA